MASLRDRSKRNSAGSSNPARYVATWKTTFGGYFHVYDRQERRSFALKSIAGLILEPSLHTVTGSNRDGTLGINAGYADQAGNKTLKVFRRDNRTKQSTLIAQGPWSSIKPAVAPLGKYTSVVFIFAQSGIAHKDPKETGGFKEKGRSGKFNCIMELNFAYTVTALLQEQAAAAGCADFDDLAGWSFKWDGMTKTENDMQGIPRDRPVFSFQDIPANSPEFKIATEQYAVVDRFLEEHWSGSAVASQAEEPEEEPEEVYEPTEEPAIDTTEDDDDLPF